MQAANESVVEVQALTPNVFKDTLVVVTRRLDALRLYMPDDSNGLVDAAKAEAALQGYKDSEDTKRSPPCAELASLKVGCGRCGFLDP